jgi:hypothetical protein
MEMTCEYCGEKFTPNPRSRTPQRFCSSTHRVYFHREGGGITRSAPAPAPLAGNSVADAIAALGGVRLPDTKAAVAITVDRTTTVYPTGWAVTVPGRSVQAAGRIRDALMEHADDLRTLARRIDQASARKSARG